MCIKYKVWLIFVDITSQFHTIVIFVTVDLQKVVHNSISIRNV